MRERGDPKFEPKRMEEPAHIDACWSVWRRAARCSGFNEREGRNSLEGTEGRASERIIQEPQEGSGEFGGALKVSSLPQAQGGIAPALHSGRGQFGGAAKR